MKSQFFKWTPHQVRGSHVCICTRLLSTFVLAFTLAGCAGSTKVADPIPLRHSKDASKSCLELQSEIYTTNLQAGQKYAVSKDKHRTNVYLGLAIPLALNMDISANDWKEAKALNRRRDYLAGLFNQFGCQGYLGFSPRSRSQK